MPLPRDTKQDEEGRRALAKAYGQPHYCVCRFSTYEGECKSDLKLAQLEAENAALVEALEFYADEENYNPAVGYGETEQVIGWMDDGPARSVLEKR